VFKRLLIWLFNHFLTGMEVVELDGLLVTRRWRISRFVETDVECYAPGGSGALQIDRRKFPAAALRWNGRMNAFVYRSSP
jgi:hypothetical protein